VCTHDAINPAYHLQGLVITSSSSSNPELFNVSKKLRMLSLLPKLSAIAMAFNIMYILNRVKAKLNILLLIPSLSPTNNSL